MTTDVLIKYLDDDKIDLDKKTNLISSSNLQLSELCLLMDKYIIDINIYALLKKELENKYDNNRFKEQIKKSDRKEQKARKEKKMKLFIKRKEIYTND